MTEQMLTENKILEKRTGSWAGKPVLVLKETDSTNIQCAKLAAEGWPEGALVSSRTPVGRKRKKGTDLGIAVRNRNLDEPAAPSAHSGR